MGEVIGCEWYVGVDSHGGRDDYSEGGTATLRDTSVVLRYEKGGELGRERRTYPSHGPK